MSRDVSDLRTFKLCGGETKNQDKSLEYVQPAARGHGHILIVASSADDAESEKGHQVEQNDAYFENRHPGIVECVELIPGQTEPSAMDALHPIMNKNEEQEPCRQYSVIDDRSPQKKVARDFGAHLILLLASTEGRLMWKRKGVNRMG